MRTATSKRREHPDERARAGKRKVDVVEILALEAAGGRRIRRRTQEFLKGTETTEREGLDNIACTDGQSA